MYENHANRTRYGDPLYIALEWKGVPNYVDGYAHVWFYSGKLITDAAYFFKGLQTTKYLIKVKKKTHPKTMVFFKLMHGWGVY